MHAPSSSRKRKQPDDEEETFRRPLDVGHDEQGEMLDRRRLLNDYISRTKIQNEYDLVDDGDEDPEADDNVLDELSRAQEEATVTQYDGIKITPFNLEEEREEGEYDKAGNFVFAKKKGKQADEEDDDEDDNWADSIDWSAVEKEEQAKMTRQDAVKPTRSTRGDDSEPSDLVRNKADCYKQMLRIVRPQETVQKTISRLGSSIPKRGFQKRKPAGDEKAESGPSSEEIAELKRKLDLMISYAHHLLEEGDTDIYQKTYEQLEEAIN